MRNALLALLLVGCGNNFEPASLLDSLRVLVVTAEPPEAPPGGTVALSALVVDTSHGDAGAVRYHWAACQKPPPLGSGQSVNLDCLDPDAGGDVAADLGDGETAAVTLPPLPSLIDVFTQWDVTNGFYLPIVLHVSNGAETVTAVYRLRYTLPLPIFGAPNQNPHVDQILLLPRADGGVPFDLGGDQSGYALEENAPPPVHAGEKLTLKATAVAGSDQPYNVLDTSALALDAGLAGLRTIPLTEQAQFNWFATAGHFSEPTTGEPKPNTDFALDKYVPAAAAGGTPIDLYVVIRDERGGASWTHRSFTLLP